MNKCYFIEAILKETELPWGNTSFNKQIALNSEKIVGILEE